jgi:putative ABC transport system substrate-binding protein
MRQLGYAEGKGVTFEHRWARGKAEEAETLALELARLKVAVIVAAGGNAALAAKQATATIPIVIATSPDPVRLGLVASLARPGGNVTGLTSLSSEVSAKQLELTRMLVPGLSRVGVLWDETSPGSKLSIAEIQAAVGTTGIAVKPVGVERSDQFDQAFQALTKERVAAVIVVVGGLLFAERKRLADLAKAHHLPMVGGSREYAEAGGVIGYGTDFPSLFRRAADYTDKILKGAKPADLPIEQATKFELAVNTKTAQALGLTLPSALLLQATEVIK